jgi:hypothetical protein
MRTKWRPRTDALLRVTVTLRDGAVMSVETPMVDG